MIMMGKKIEKHLQVKLKQNISKDYKDGAVTYPHGLQPNIYSSCAFMFHIVVQSNLLVLAIYLDTLLLTYWTIGRWPFDL